MWGLEWRECAMIGEWVGKVAAAIIGGVVIMLGLIGAAVVVLICGRPIPPHRGAYRSK